MPFYVHLLFASEQTIQSIFIIPYSQKQKKPTELEKLSSAGFGLPSGAFFFLPSKELLGGHAPMNSNIVTVVFPDLDPVNQLGDHQMLGFVAGIVKAAGPAQDLVHLDFVQEYLASQPKTLDNYRSVGSISKEILYPRQSAFPNVPRQVPGCTEKHGSRFLRQRKTV